MKQLLSVLLALFCGAATAFAQSGGVPLLSVHQLNERLGAADLVVIDVRTGSDWRSATEKIAGALREHPAAVAEWAPRYDREAVIVLYCS